MKWEIVPTYHHKETNRYGAVRYYNEKNELHREDGPAVEYYTGDKLWYFNGEIHRTNGPAIERADGRKFWYLNDKEYTEEDFIKATNPVKELSIAEIEKLLGYQIKVVK